MSDEIATYLGPKGYSIFKENISVHEQELIRKDLTIKAFVPKSSIAKPMPFPIYRESPNKIYMPRFYGMETFGEPDAIQITDGDDINVEFVGLLRDFQKPIVEKYLKVAKIKGGGLLEIHCGGGKCLGLNTPVMMYDGTIKLVQNIIIGDKLMGDDSTSRTVLKLAKGSETMYKIIQANGESYIVNKSHILSLKCMRKCRFGLNGEIIDISVEEYINLPKYYHTKRGPLHGYKVPIEFHKKEIHINPYLLGFKLGTTNEPKYKHIPHAYKCNSREIQLEVLAGLIDSAGSFTHRGYEITHENEQLREDILFLARSLGFSAYKKSSALTFCTIVITSSNLDNIPVQFLRNKIIPRAQLLNKNMMGLSTNITVQKMGTDNYYGFEIDGNRRFVLGDFTVTHNTVMGIKIITELKKKTLIIVHKEFLLQQWIERINQFIPNARVGKIQGEIIDIDDKDIVIGMLQSLSMKKYPTSIFQQFGLTIIDECHHIAAQVFSNALFQIVTKYMLGLSATMKRKDGLSFAFKMFIGDVVYKKERECTNNVTIKGIYYQTNDENFSKVEYNYRGQVHYALMIKKLCEFNRRSEFILKILQDSLKHAPEQQFIILAHNKNVLKYLYDAIKHRDFATVGYYIGGMKQKDLKLTETKKIIIATYAMAEEALDIKSLTSLLMVTPKSDVRQAVGRILRKKQTDALVFDIIDMHGLFQRQWTKRCTWYRKQKFTILSIDSNNYGKTSWDTLSTGGKRLKKIKQSIDESANNMLQGVCLL